jgi:iron complex outermembrane recepter protein
VVPVKNGIVNDVYYTDLQVDYTLQEHNATLSFGIDNVFDQLPPASYANAPINYDMYTYDIMGRYFFVRVTKNF